MNERFEEWALIELFGHQRISGRISEQQLGGETFVRVDVPATKGLPGYTKLYGKGAIYGITITDEKTATMAAAYYAPAPMDKWTIDQMLGKRRLLEGGEDTYEPDEFDIGEED